MVIPSTSGEAHYGAVPLELSAASLLRGDFLRRRRTASARQPSTRGRRIAAAADAAQVRDFALTGALVRLV